MSGDWAAGPRVSHDLIVEPGRMDGSVEMLVGAGLQDYAIFHHILWCWCGWKMAVGAVWCL